MTLLKNAELFAKAKHAGKLKKSGTTYSNHLENVVSRLKSLGVIDEEVLCAAWLHDILEDTDTSFDELFEKFGRRIAVMILSLTKTKFVIDTDDDSTLSLTKKRAIPEKQREKEYAIKIKESDIEAKLIKLCDISANLSDLKKQTISKTKKRKILKKFRHYISIIEKDLKENTEYPKTIMLLETINESLKIQTQNGIKIK
ncbi:MAG: HD domain-containing protein [Candidatus Nitrosopumilus limneticus]|nr:HD domain-containing protein [Candidatus Nitrosopumilus limneticus]MDC4213220.1 HD domain-containing protein [Candidatus Nitrosopumilus limneticus]MDC4215665.1 HD domain-containing protein [Candidatus Nitrosopumilus limneticus]MDC4217065.1 HD domain-containing protein [Candidatus Nitrosopumilus limneticus]MDC4217926.1 HD domain-containing protein [Candidatus Nitrosopumilus limneticus]